ncbi:MAG TPA: hypothetical protein VLC91_01505 [Spongiibacteraceae bacterium]|nr:hypothetical protein [Spongiibacteraceae bacterium]
MPEVGWALDAGCERGDDAACNADEASQLYRVLEQEVVPCFYRRDQRGLPREWIARMRACMAQLAPQYSGNRMLREYTERYYLPLAAAFARRDSSGAAAVLKEWHTQLERHWCGMHFGNVTYRTAAQLHRFEVQVYLEEMPATDYTPRIVPHHALASVPLEANFILWYRGTGERSVFYRCGTELLFLYRAPLLFFKIGRHAMRRAT